MKTYEEALALVLESVHLLPEENATLDDLLGRVLAQPIVAPIDLPPFDNAAVDGYALAAADAVRTPLRIVGSIPAGADVTATTLGPGEALRIFTGSPIPPGADAVVMQESVSVSGERLMAIDEPVQSGANVRRRGEEVRTGQTVFPAGSVVTPPVLGALATLGFHGCQVRRPPRVAVIGTGSELVSPGLPLPPGGVYESNTFGVRAALHGLGVRDVGLYRTSDDPDQTREVLSQALSDADVVVTCGGVSVGDHDLVRPTLAALGVEERVWRVAIKPGKPFFFGQRGDGRIAFGLPGNPVSALVVFTLFVRPALLKMVGAAPRPSVRVRLAHDVPAAVGRDEFLRARLEWGQATLTARRLEAQGSHMLTGLAEADCLVRVPANAGPLAEGDLADAYLLRWRIDG